MEYYQAGGLDTTEELELALLLRDQELIHSEVARGQFPWLYCIFFQEIPFFHQEPSFPISIWAEIDPKNNLINKPLEKGKIILGKLGKLSVFRLVYRFFFIN